VEGGLTTSPPAVDAAVRGGLTRLLGGFRDGVITLSDAEGDRVLGVGGDLRARISVHSSAAYGAFLTGSRGLARAYADGLWDSDDLVSLVRIAARALSTADPWRERLAALTGPFERLLAASRSNTRSRSRDNVERHYDLGNDFFALVLDETLAYSCAYFEREEMTLAEASRAKLERVCRLLDLRPGDRLLEMGSGWGSLALHAAKHFGCRVSTVTISPSQRDHIESAARSEGVADRVEVVLSDYRDVRGTWDKLASVEMIEAIGAEHLDTFIARCGGLLPRGGVMVLQAITQSERLYRVNRYRRNFLNDIIFPGGCAPSLEAIARAAARRTSLRVAAVHDITAHYPPTLRAWRERLERNWPRIERLGRFDETFRRTWRLYFAYCEAAFLERRLQDRQIVLANPGWRGENRLLEA
jgi:cyclopropane-fatty-acyl-phospholipid synthase